MTEKKRVDDLVKSYHDTADRLREIQGKAAEAKRVLLGLLQQEADEKNVPEETLQQAKSEYDHLNLKTEAFQDRLDSLRNDIAAWVPESARQGLEAIQKDFEAPRKEKETLNREFLATAAKAAVLRERITGPALLNTGRDHKAMIPSLKVDIGRMSQEDSVYYIEQIEKARRENGAEAFQETCEGRWHALQREKERLEGILSNPETEVSRLLGPLPVESDGATA